MKVIFFGTPDYVIPILEALYIKLNRGKMEKQLIGVVTQPPKPSGREKRLEYSPVDKWAFEKKLEIILDLDKVPSADLGVLAAYGRIIPQRIIDKFKYGILNVHPSLLPKYRGASPIQSAIAAGETQTGVTIIKLDSQMDHGPIVSQLKEEIKDTDTNESLMRRLFDRSANFLVELIPNYINGKVTLKEQNHKEATFTKILGKEDGFIKPKVLKDALDGKEPESIERLIRAMYPWPTAWSEVKIKEGLKRIKILSSHIKDGKLVLDQVQLEGKNTVGWKQFLEGYPNSSF